MALKEMGLSVFDELLTYTVDMKFTSHLYVCMI